MHAPAGHTMYPSCFCIHSPEQGTRFYMHSPTHTYNFSDGPFLRVHRIRRVWDRSSSLVVRDVHFNGRKENMSDSIL